MSLLRRALARAGVLALSVVSLGCERGSEEAAPTVAAAGFAASGDGQLARVGAATARVRRDGVIALEAGVARLELETVSVTRGGRAATAAGAVTAAQAVSAESRAAEVHIERGDVDERVRAVADGVEQSWTFAERPAGDGDLEVAVAARSARAIDKHGEDLVLTVAGGRFRYSRALWIDAAGRQSPIAVEASGGTIRVVVPDSLVDASTYPVLLDPTITAEAPFDAPAAGAASPRQEGSPAIVAGAAEMLVAWQTDQGEIHARRVTPSSFVEPAGLVVGSGGSVGAPTVAWNGTRYLVAWERDGDVVGARVSAGGAVVDAAPFVIAAAPGAQRAPRASSDGSGFVVVWQDGRNGGDDIYAARVSDAGATLDPAGIAISTDAADEGEPAIAFAGGDYVVAWDRQTSVQAARLTSGGSVADAAPIADVGVAVDDAALSFDGQDLLVAWRTVAGGGVTGAVASPALAAGAPFTIVASGADGLGVAFDGANHLVAYHGAAVGLRAIQVTPTGSLVAAAGFDIDALASAAGALAVAFDGGALFVAHGQGDEVLGARVAPAGSALESGLLVSSRINAQERPRVAASTVGIYLAVWQDDRGGSSHVRAARIIDEVLDDPALDLGDGSAPAVAWDGANFVVVFEQGGDLVARRVAQSGTVEPGTLPVTSATGVQRAPAVAAGASGHVLVAWIDERGGQSDIYAGRLDDGAQLDGDGVLLHAGAEVADGLAAGFDGTSYLAVWRREVSGGGQAIEARRVGANGVPTGASPIALSSGALSQGAPAIASDGQRYLVAFRYEPAAGSHDLRALLVSDMGMIDDTVTLATGAGASRDGPSASFDGNGFLVGWIETPAGGDGDLLAAAVEPGGAVLTTLTVAAGGDDEAAPALASAGNSESAAIYLRLEPTPQGEVARARWRLVTPLGLLGESCGDGSECASGFCVDGLCCDSACDDGINPCRVCSVAAGASSDGSCVTIADGAVCDDGDACTDSTCSAGVCQIDQLVECTATGECVAPGMCDPLVGCSAVAVPDGTPCSKGSCVGGLCTPEAEDTPPPAPPPTTTDGCGCRLARPVTPGSLALLGLFVAALGLRLRRRAS